ncbi:MAG: hypothetical protein ACXABX_01150, partial [Candidatus Thorarchaeota archaeon]
MRRIYGVYLILIIMLFPAMLLYDDSSPYGISAIDSTIISDVEVSQILTDPDLIHQTSYNISGNSGEFSYSHYHILDSYNGVSALEFNHVANTTLVQGAGYPEEDFVFITQEFEWPYEMLPTTAIVKYTATTEMTGDFATYSTLDNRRMLGLFQIYIIDSLGNWEICQNNYLPFESYYDTYSRDIAGVIDETWDGLIEDQHGVQEDPQDILKVAFVLKPSYHFFEGPSETLSGSIIVKINNVGLVVSRSIEIDEIRRLSPVWKTSWNQFDLNEENG